MRRIALVLFAVMAMTFGVVSSASAQDLNCSDFNGDQEAAQRELNSTWPSDPHTLDGDNDGWACEGVFGYTGSVPNAMNQGGGGDTDNGDDNGDTDNGDDNGDDNGTTTLPETGTGAAASAGSMASLFGAVAGLLLIVGAAVRRTATFRV